MSLRICGKKRLLTCNHCSESQISLFLKVLISFTTSTFMNIFFQSSDDVFLWMCEDYATGLLPFKPKTLDSKKICLTQMGWNEELIS